MGRKVFSLLAGGVACAALAACSTDGVTDLTNDAVTLLGTVQATSDGPLSYSFQYATSADALGTAGDRETPAGTAPAGAITSVSARVSGLAADGAGTTFFYRLCSRPGGVEKCFGTREFSTPPAGSRRAIFDKPGPSSFTVPAGVTAVTVDAAGGAGGSIPGSPFTDGGRGGRVRSTFAVSPGDKLVIRTGSAGASAGIDQYTSPTGHGGAGGTNGVDRGGDGGEGAPPNDLGPGWGGGGGGAPSRVDLVPAGQSTETTRLVAGGGGGAAAGDSSSLDVGGPGGSPGGNGVGPAPGRGATASAGGAGGWSGGAGAALKGGAGQSNTTAPPAGHAQDAPVIGLGGGGGGGGRFGGGGGEAGHAGYLIIGGFPLPDIRFPSGAGGGSSYAFDGGATFTTGSRAGSGIVTVTWAAP